MTITFVPGLQPNDRTKRRVTLRRAPGVTLTPPAAVDWLAPVTHWEMLGNDTVGDCTAAGAAHAQQTLALSGRRLDLHFTVADALTFYEAISGYQPGKPATDVGATLQDALNYWRKTGIGGHTIVAFALLDAGDLDLVRNCISIFGSVYCGLSVAQSAMDQINARKPWTYVARSKILGGHCVPISGYTASSFKCVTWGQTQQMDLNFYNHYFDEVWVPITMEWLSAAGVSAQGLDTTALNADFTALTGEPAPFAAVTPTPVPTTSAATLLESIRAQIAAWQVG